jgi:5-methylcytosine-specific restriction endonuclease McrA
VTKFETTWLEDKSDEALLEEIRRVSALLSDQPMTKKSFNPLAKVSSSFIENRFGSWSEAIRRAGIANALPLYTDDAIIADLKRVSELLLNEPLTYERYSDYGRYSKSTMKRRLGGWQNALEKADLGHRYSGPITTERMKSQPARSKSDEQIIQELQDVHERLGGGAVSGAQIEDNSDISQSMLNRRFGSVSAALKKAGLEQAAHGRRYTEDEVFENLLNVWTHFGRPPTALEMDKAPSVVGKNTYITRYGGWRKALKAFVARASSEIDVEPALDREQEPSTLAESTEPTESPTTGATATRKPQHASQTSLRSRVTRPAPTNVKLPEDRRDPSIGLRFKVLKRDRFKCVLCGDHPARNAECVLHVDHLIPWSKDGKTREDNLRTLCANCNIGRGNRFDD